ncbi:MAG: ligase-associated DNA damage response endonuclease PdeM [Pseudomonadota bacterium]
MLAGAALEARASGGLWWREQSLLAVSDLHFGKSERIARLGGPMLPPYETHDTLARLDAEIAALAPKTVLCLGDSFDDSRAARGLSDAVQDWLTRLMAGRDWIWIEGNHDPGPLQLGGTHLAEMRMGPLTFRHIALEGAEPGEISGHYHPKAVLPTRGRQVSRPCFLCDERRIVMPAFGTYTGGLPCHEPVLSSLMSGDARAVMIGRQAVEVPMPGRVG